MINEKLKLLLQSVQVTRQDPTPRGKEVNTLFTGAFVIKGQIELGCKAYAMAFPGTKEHAAIMETLNVRTVLQTVGPMFEDVRAMAKRGLRHLEEARRDLNQRNAAEELHRVLLNLAEYGTELPKGTELRPIMIDETPRE